MSRNHPGPVVRLLRTASGVSLRGLARDLGVSPTFMHQVETGQGAPPSPERLRQVAERLGIPPRFLMATAGVMAPDLEAFVRATPEAQAFLHAFIASGADPALLQVAADRLVASGAVPWSAEPAAGGAATTLEAAAGSSALPALDPAHVALGLRAVSGGTVLERLARLAAREVGGLTAADLSAALGAPAEDDGMRVGGGVALPHLWVTGLDAPALYLAQIPRGAPWTDAVDAPLVRLAVLCLSPTEDEGHIARLARLAAVLADEALVKRLVAAAEPGEVVSLLAAADGRQGA